MKPWIKKIIVGATVLTASVGLTACSTKKNNNNKKPQIKEYTFENYEDTYIVNQPFSIVGTVLKLTMSDGTTKDVEITESMIKTAPDMTKLGEQTVVIEYEGKRYEFKITIEQHVEDGLIAKLKDFLNKYESNKDSSIDITIKPNVIAKYLQDTATVDEETSVKLLSTMFDEDALADALYNAVFDGVVEGSFNINEDFIIDSDSLKANLDTVKVLESLKKSGMKFDFKKYAVKKAMPDENSEEIQALITEICNILEIDSISGQVAIEKVVIKNYNKIRESEQVDYTQVVSEILNCAKIYSSNTMIKDMCANLEDLSTESLIHFISSMKKSQWLNYGKIVTKESFSNWYLEDEKLKVITNSDARNLLKKRAQTEENIAIACENMFISLVNASNAEDVKTIIVELLTASSEYASEMVEISKTLKNKNQVMVLDNNGSIENFGMLMFEQVGNDFVCYVDYDAEIEYYSTIAEECESYAQSIKTHGFLKTIKNKEIVEQLFDSLEYPEEDKEQAIENVYAILNSELYGDELYWAIADVLFPNNANEYFETIKTIIKNVLEDGIVAAVKENEVIELVFDSVVAEYPEQDRDEAIQNIYSIIEGEKQGQEIYSTILEILVPNSKRSEEIDMISNYICDSTSVDLTQGRKAMHDVITKYYSKLLSVEQVDFKAMAQEIVEVIKNYSEDEEILATIELMESESAAEAIKILEVVEQLFDTYLVDYPEEKKQQAIETIYSIIEGEKQGEELQSAIYDILLIDEIKDSLVESAAEKICSISSIYSEQGENAVKDVVNKYFEQLIKLQGIDVRAALEEIGEVINEYTDYELVKQVTENLNSQDINELVHLFSDIYRVTATEDYVVIHKNDVCEEFYTIIETEEAKKLIEDYVNIEARLIEGYENELLNLNDITSINDVLDLVKRCLNNAIDYHNNSISYWESQRGADLVVGFYDYDSYCIDSVCHMYYDYNNHSYEIDVDDTIKYRHNPETIEKLEQHVDYIDILSDLCDGSYESLSDLLDENKDKWVGSLLDEMNYPEEKKQQAIDTIVSVIKGEKKGEDLYFAFVDVLTPKQDDYYIDYATGMICWLASVDSNSGEEEIRDIISTYYNKLINAEEFDVRTALEELSVALNTYSTNDYVKQATADLNTQDINEAIHLISNIARIQIANTHVIVDKFNANCDPYETINTAEAQQVIDEWSDLNVGVIRNFENEILNLINNYSVNNLFDVAKNCVDKLHDYYYDQIHFWEDMRNSEMILARINGDTAEPVCEILYESNDGCVLDIDEQIDNLYSEIDNCYKIDSYIDLFKDLYNNPYETMSRVLNENKDEWFGGLLEKAGYPEENKQHAIDLIESIIKGEKQDKDIYIALMEILVPNSNKQSQIDSLASIICNKTFIESEQGYNAMFDLIDIYYSKLLTAEEVDLSAFAQEILDIVEQHTENETLSLTIKAYKSESLTESLEIFEVVEKVFDSYLSEYPEEKKEQAIETIYSILKGEKQGEELHSAIMEVLVPNDESYVEMISEALSNAFAVETEQGKEAVQQIIETNFNKLLSAEGFDANTLVLDLVKAVEEHTSSEYIKVYAKNINSNNMKHFLSDMIYADYKHHYDIVTLAVDGDYYGQPVATDAEALELLERYMSNIKNVVYNFENKAYDLASMNSIVDVLDCAHSIVVGISEYYAEEIAILEDLRNSNYMIMVKEYEDAIPGYVVDDNLSTMVDFFPAVRHSYNLDGSIKYHFDEEIEIYEQAGALYDNIAQTIEGVKLLISDPQEIISGLIEEYKDQAVSTILNMCYELLEVDPSSEFAQAVNEFALDCVDSYIAGTFNKQEALKEIDNIIETYASDETKTVLKATFMLYNAINFDESIDYNEIFKDLELPEEIKDVDFNVLIKKIMDKDTYDIFKFNNVEIEYITNDKDEIVAEKLTLKVEVDFDVMISSMKGDVEITMILDLDGKI